MGASLSAGRAAARPSGAAGAATMPRMPSDGPLGTSEREPSPYVELDRDTWASLASEETTHLSAEEVERLRGFGEALDLDEVRQVYLPLSRLLSLRVRRPTAAPQAGGVPPASAAAAYAVRDRARRLRRRRQVDDRPAAAADARPLARPPPRRAGHHRRLPLPQRRARTPRHHAPQGFPGVLRPPGAAPVRHRDQVRPRRGRPPRSTPTWSTTSSRTNGSWSRARTSSSSRASTSSSRPGCARTAAPG